MSLDSNSAIHRERRSLFALTLVEGLLDTGVGLRSFDAPSRGYRGGTHIGTLSSLLRRSLIPATFLLEHHIICALAIKDAGAATALFMPPTAINPDRRCTRWKKSGKR